MIGGVRNAVVLYRTSGMVNDQIHKNVRKFEWSNRILYISTEDGHKYTYPAESVIRAYMTPVKKEAA
jgi:hypothetical protein